MQLSDWSVLAILTFEVLAQMCSQYRANSAYCQEGVAVAVAVYFAVKLTAEMPMQAWWTSGLFSIAATWLAISGIRQFANSAARISKVELVDLVAFRSVLISIIREWIPGEGFTVLLLLLPFACASAVYLLRMRKSRSAFIAVMPTLLTVAALTLSLSRAVFWSVILFFILSCALMFAYRIINVKTVLVLLAAALSSLPLILVLESAIYPGIFTAYTNRHISQIRSTEGRLGIWSRSLEIVREHPLLGVGSSNAALFLLSTADQGETIGFASRPFSLPIQVLVEKGIVGFGLYTAFLILVGYEFHRTMRSLPLTGVPHASTRAKPKRKQETLHFQAAQAHKAMKCCFAAGLLAVLFRELTYSSLLEHTLTIVLAFVLAALARQEVSVSA